MLPTEISGNAERTPITRAPTRTGCSLIVVLTAKMRDQILALEMPQSVLQLHQLNEEIVFGIEARRVLRRLEVEGQPLLNAAHARALRQVHEQRDVEDDRRGEDAVAAEEVDLQLHRIAEPPEEIDVVPAFFVVAARRIVVDADHVEQVLVQLRIEMRLEDVVERRLLAFFLRLERLRIVQHFAVAVAENVRRVPAADAQHARLEAGGDDRLDQRLPRLHVLAGDRRLRLRGQLDERGDVRRQVRRGVRIRNAFLDGGIRVDHARGNRDVAGLEARLEGGERLMDRALLQEDLRAASPDHHDAIEVVVLLELMDVGDHLIGEVALVLALLDVRARQPLHVVLIEHGRPRPDLLELGPHLVEQRLFDDAGRLRGAVAVFLKDVPAAEYKVVEASQRHDLIDLRRAAFRPLAKADRAHLGQRADGGGQSFTNGEHAGNGGGADGAEADKQDSEFAACRSDINWCRHKQELYQPSDARVNCHDVSESVRATRRFAPDLSLIHISEPTRQA